MKCVQIFFGIFAFDWQVLIQWQGERGLLLSVRIKSRRSAGAHISPLTPTELLATDRKNHRAALQILFLATDPTISRVAFEDLLKELGPSILPASHSHYQRLLCICFILILMQEMQTNHKVLQFFPYSGLLQFRTNYWWATGMFDRSTTSSGQWLLLIRYISSFAGKQRFIIGSDRSSLQCTSSQVFAF